MVKPLKLRKGRLLTRAICLLGCGVVVAATAQDTLRDPTRPPASLGATHTSATAATSAPVLQSVLISPARKVAVINGETVQTGDRLGDARVTKIIEGEVVLVRDGQSQTLKLFPGIEKRQAKSGVSVKEAGRRH